MILNQKLYRKIEREEKKAYLKKISDREAVLHLEELFEFAKPFFSKKPRPQPIALALLIKKR